MQLTSFEFISDDTLRALIERDKQEMDNCLEHRFTKSTLVLAGSVIEAILVDYFLAFAPKGRTKDQILRANLADLIEWAAQSGLISERTKELTAAIRGYRNLIHPGKEYRMQEQCDIHSATVAKHLVEIIISEMAGNYAERLGYTAEQAITKVCLDPGCISIFPDMIDKMSVVERIKLFRAIPQQFSHDEFELETVIRSLTELHQQLSAHIPTDVVAEEASRLYSLVQNNTKDEAIFYLRFYGTHLNLIASRGRQTILTYILSVIAKEPSEALSLWQSWRVFRDLGTTVADQNEAQLVVNSITTRLRDTSPLGDDVFVAILQDILSWMSPPFRSAIIDALREVAEHNKRALEWKGMLYGGDEDDDVPF